MQFLKKHAVRILRSFSATVVERREKFSVFFWSNLFADVLVSLLNQTKLTLHFKGFRGTYVENAELPEKNVQITEARKWQIE